MYKDAIPSSWSRYAVDDIGLSVWLQDFGTRVEQLNKMSDDDYVNSPHANVVWLGGLYSPEGFVAATMQYVGQQNKWKLEDLLLDVDIGNTKASATSFIFNGLTLYGAGWDDKSGCLV
eukprot:UN01844